MRKRKCGAKTRHPITIQPLENRLMMSINITLNANEQYQTITGFGSSVYNGSGAPYDQPVGSAQYNNFISDYTKDLGANLLRLDADPDVMPTAPATRLGTNLQANIAALNFNSSNAKFYGNMAKAISAAENGTTQIMVTVWSPPAWMKANDSVSAVLQPDGHYYSDQLNHLNFQDNTIANIDNQNNLIDPTTLTQFARYCAAYVAGMQQTYGIKISGFSIQNELLFDESYASCQYWTDPSLDPTDVQYRRYAEVVKAVGEEFLTDGLTANIVGPESVGPDGDTRTFLTRQMDYIIACDADTVVDQYGNTAGNYLADYAIHGWSNDGTNASSGPAWWSQYETLLNAEPIARPSWQTEESGEATTWLGANSDGTANPLRGALGMAVQLHDTLTSGDVTAYYYLSVTSGHLTGSTSDLMDSTAATAANPERTDVPQFKYDVFKHWSHFVASGSTRIGADFTDGNGNTIAADPTTIDADAYLDNTGKTLTVELTNESASSQVVHFSLDGVGVSGFTQDWLTDATDTWTNLGAVTFSNGVASVVVPAYSVITLQGSTASFNAAGTVYLDSDGNGVRDAGEAGVSGKTVYLDLNNNGVFDPGEPSTTTASDGTYSFAGLVDGSYTARVVAAAGWSGGNAATFTSTGSAISGAELAVTEITPVAIPGSGYTVAEGSSITLNGAASTGPVAIYQWDLNYNGMTFNPTASGVTPGFSASGLDGPSSRTVALEVTSVNGLVSAPVTTTVSITNVAPTATFTGSSVAAGQSATVSFSGQTDPSSADVAAGFTYRYDFNNDGVYDLTTSAPTATVPASYLTSAGTYKIGGQISDKDGGTTTYTTTVTVAPAVVVSVKPLTGTVIGTAGSYKNDGDTIAKAVDGNLSTFFDGPNASNNWVGLDLGSPTVITSLAYASRTGFASRMNGGIFQASNSATFASGLVNLYTVSSTANPSSTALTTQTDTVATAYRYVRYLSPSNSYGNVSEIEFFGKTVTKLTGTAIGTAGSYQNDGDTIASAVDGNLASFFDGPTANGNWVGLDLGSAQIVKQIAFDPRTGFASRMVGGIFQASNTANFSSGVVNLYTITSAPAQNALTTVTVNSSVAYRYLRYLSPTGSYGNVSEIAFYG